MQDQYASMKDKDINGIRLQVGMPLVDKDGNFAGKVVEIYHSEILVDRTDDFHSPPHVYIPLSACHMDTADQLRLNIREDEVDEQGWRESQKSD